MKYTTFENKSCEICELDHQHLSNIYWYYLVIIGIPCSELITNEIERRFGKIILPYRPKSTYKYEIDTLNNKGLLFWKEVGGLSIADIVYRGEKIGEACYAEAYREIQISKIIEE